MDYYIEPKSENEYEALDFPATLSYFFEQIGGYDDKSIVSQIEKILDIDLSIFQKTYNPEMEFDFEEFDENQDELNSDNFWIDIDFLIDKLNEFKAKMECSNQYFSEIIFNPKDETHKILKMEIAGMIRYQEENPLTLYPVNSGIVTEKSLDLSVSELIKTLENLKSDKIKEIRLVYG